jgi:hypothetical protein
MSIPDPESYEPKVDPDDVPPSGIPGVPTHTDADDRPVRIDDLDEGEVPDEERVVPEDVDDADFE